MTQIPIILPKLPLDTICGDLEGPEFKRLKSILGRDLRTASTTDIQSKMDADQGPNWFVDPWFKDYQKGWKIGRLGESTTKEIVTFRLEKAIRNPDFDFLSENLIFTQIHQNHQSSLISQNCHLTELFFNRSRRHTDDQKSEMIINFVKYMFRFHKFKQFCGFQNSFQSWSK